MQVYRTNPDYLQEFQDVEFPREKGEAFRVIAIGGSAVHGWRLPDRARQNFLAGVVGRLRRAHPGRAFEGINAGGCAWGSYRETLLVAELLRYRPDALVVMSGNNETWEDPLVREFTAPGFNRFRLVEAAEHSRALLALFDAAMRIRRLAPALPRLTGRYEELDDAAMADVVRRFTANLRTIIGLCRAARVPVVLGTTPANLRVEPDLPTDWLVGSSRHTPGLPAARRAAWEAAWREGDAARARGDPARALAAFRRAAAADPGYVRVHREAGLCLAALGRTAAARAELWTYVDGTRRLVTRALNDATRRVGAAAGVPVVDCAAVFEAAAPGGLPGYDLFVDSMHPNVRGHDLLARAFFPAVDRLVPPAVP